jgi:hypothetical protein
VKLYYQAFILLLLATSCGKNISKEPITRTGNHFIESELAKRMGVDQRLFTIDTKKDTIINLRKGGRINISDSSFSDQAQQIHIAVKEIYSLADMILENMHSESSEVILSSGGKFKIECQEQNIQINPNYPIIIEIPTFTIVEGMKCYKANFE